MMVISCARTASAISRSPLDLAQVLAETIEALPPIPPVAGQPVGGLLERLALQPRRPQLRAALARDQARPLEHLQMLGDRLHGDRKRLCELVDGGVALREPGQDPASSRVRERRERPAQLVDRHLLFTFLVDKPLGGIYRRRTFPGLATCYTGAVPFFRRRVK